MACKQDPLHPDKIEFLYNFIKGECPNSFGMNVALMSGLNQDIVQKAKIKSREFDQKMQNLSKNCSIKNGHKSLYHDMSDEENSSQK
jgi:DNA mismatch repair ATPase MutS